MPHKHDFTATLFKGGDEANASFFVIVPAEVVADFGRKGQVKVKVSLEGFTYRTSIAPYGGQHYLGVRKEIRDTIGKTGGDTLHISMEVDEEPRLVAVPDDFSQAMANQDEVRPLFDKLSYTHRKEYVEWIEGAKKAETRQRRIEKAVQMLLEGVKTPRRS
jgi:hypothetical protein